MKQNVQSVLPLLPSEVLEEELEKARFVKDTERGGNKIYIFSGKDCPQLMMQVGILREMSFRGGGGGTGLSIDIDRWDEFSHPDFSGPYAINGFKQLIVWDPDEKDIVGGYRYAKMLDFVTKDRLFIDTPTIELFDCSKEFIRLYAPYTIELGRSFVQPKYQLRADYMPPKKALHALDNLFDGLGTLVVDYNDEHIQYFFGKVTMYKTYNRTARNMILYYLNKHFPDTHHLVTPKPDLIPPGLYDEIDFLKEMFVGNTEKEDKQILIKSLRSLKQTMPQLFKKYPEMSSKMKVFGSAINHHCGEVEETGIMIKFSDIVEEYKTNYIRKYFQKRFGKLFL